MRTLPKTTSQITLPSSSSERLPDLPTNEERLATIEANTARILKILDGNGQPGVVAELARIDTRMGYIEQKADSRARTGVVGGVTGSVTTATLFSSLAIILQKLGVLSV